VNIAMTAAIRVVLGRDKATVDPRTYLSAARDEIAATVRSLVTVVSAEVH
jgi:fructose/tagatose bisphosphate aldolase